jgi:hypothetical protein
MALPFFCAFQIIIANSNSFSHCGLVGEVENQVSGGNIVTMTGLQVELPFIFLFP